MFSAVFFFFFFSRSRPQAQTTLFLLERKTRNIFTRKEKYVDVYVPNDLEYFHMRD